MEALAVVLRNAQQQELFLSWKLLVLPATR